MTTKKNDELRKVMNTLKTTLNDTTNKIFDSFDDISALAEAFENGNVGVAEIVDLTQTVIMFNKRVNDQIEMYKKLQNRLVYTFPPVALAAKVMGISPHDLLNDVKAESHVFKAFLDDCEEEMEEIEKEKEAEKAQSISAKISFPVNVLKDIADDEGKVIVIHADKNEDGEIKLSCLNGLREIKPSCLNGLVEMNPSVVMEMSEADVRISFE